MRHPLDLLPIRAQSRRQVDAPVPYVGRGWSLPWAGRNDAESNLRAMGSVGTLFAIVHRTSTATSAVDWHLWRKSPTGRDEDREEVTSHAALDTWNSPNDFFTQELFVETFQQHRDLVGEGWWVVARHPAIRSLPLELWPVRPDRMYPVPHPKKYLSGYIYLSPDGEQVPLGLDEVIQIRTPNPVDSYRGIGPVQTIKADLEGVELSSAWNRNFFLNSAQPGGVVEVPNNWDDDEFNQFNERWREQHQGVANAHRVALLEGGAKWVSTKYTMQEMQFAELRSVSREVIREAFGIPKFAVGDVEDINRSTADASKSWFAEQLTVPRLEKIKQALNSRFLPMYGETGRGLEFDYVSPVPDDREADDRERESKATTYETLTRAGVDHEDAAMVAGLPPMRRAVVLTAPPPAPAPAPPAARVHVHLDRPADPRRALPAHAPAPARPRNAEDLPPEELPDVAPVLESWEEALSELLADWEDVTAEQRDALIGQVRQAIGSGDLEALSRLEAPADDAQAALLAAMVALAAIAAQQAADEAAAQEVEIEPVEPEGAALAGVAAVTAALLASGLAASAAAEAMRVAVPGRSGEEEADRVAGAVREHLEDLTDAQPRQHLGAALHSAQHAARGSTFKAVEGDKALPSVAYYATERNESGTRCKYCTEVNGRWLGNTYAEALAEYPLGAYIRCLGGTRCKGLVTAVWRGGKDRKGWIEKEPA